MTADLMLKLAVLVAALLAIAWFRRRTAAAGKTADVAMLAMPDREQIRLRPWQELADAICARLLPNEDPARMKRLFARYNFQFSRAGEFAIDPPPEVVDAVIAQVFPATPLAAVRHVLGEYRNLGPTVSDGRIALDIVKLSQGDADKLPGLVRVASADFRDIVAQAEAPRLMASFRGAPATPGSPGEPDGASASDLQAYVAWLKTLPGA